MEYKTIPLADYELKAGSDGWMFSAYASTFGNKDLGGDIIQKGAFAVTLKDPNRDRPLLWQHMGSEPIGKELSLKEDSKGLFGSWELVDTQRGTDAYKLLKRGVVRSMSIGYIPAGFEFEDNGDTRVLKDIDLLENSVVSIPMNDQARVTTVKNLPPAEQMRAALITTIVTALQSQTAKEVPDYDLSKLSLGDHAKLLGTIADAFGERTRDLLAKLQSGDFSLTDSKRNDLHAILETFSGLDAVRSDAKALVEHAPDSPVEGEPEPSVAKSTLALSIELRRRRLRAAHGVEV